MSGRLFFSGMVECFHQRTHGASIPAPWLLTLCVPGYPQCRAVVDDFGDLVPVEQWA